MQSPRPRSAASEADSVQDPPSPSAVAASLHSSRAQSPSMQTRSSQSSPGQQAYEARLHNALSPTAKPPMQSHASQPNRLVSSPSRAPASCPSSAAASPVASAMSDMIAAMSRPSSASPASKSGQVSPQLSGSVASAASSRPASAGSQQYQPNVHVTEVPVSGTATPARSATQSLPQSPRPTSAPASQASLVKPNRAPSAAEQAAQAAMAAITGLRAAPAAAHKAPPAAIKAISVGTEAPASPAEESAVPSSPPVTTPVRKPPGLPSPVTHLSGQDSADLDDAAVSSDRWADEVSSKSDTASNPRSPTKAVAALHPAQPSQPAPLSGTAWSEALSESASDDGSQASQLTGNGQPLDMSKAAVAERLAREQKQQREQEAKHLASKARAAKRRAKEIAEQDRRQQEEHAARAEAKARQRREKAEKEALAGRSIAGPFQGPSSNRGAALRGGPASREERRDYDEGPSQQAPKSYPAQGVRHVPAHPAPRAAALEHHNGRPVYTGDSGSEYDHSPGPGSDYGAGSEGYDYVPARGGRGAARGRGAAVRGRGGRGPSSQGAFSSCSVSACWAFGVMPALSVRYLDYTRIHQVAYCHCERMLLQVYRLLASGQGCIFLPRQACACIHVRTCTGCMTCQPLQLQKVHRHIQLHNASLTGVQVVCWFLLLYSAQVCAALRFISVNVCFIPPSVFAEQFLAGLSALTLCL